MQFVKLMFDVFTEDNPVTVPNVAVIGVDIAILAVPLQVPETVKFIEDPYMTDSLSPLCHGNDRVELTVPVPAPPPPPPHEVTTNDSAVMSPVLIDLLRRVILNFPVLCYIPNTHFDSNLLANAIALRY